MSSVVLLKLLGVFGVIAVGWLAGRAKVVGPDAAGVLTRVAFVVFVPALLFRTMAGIDVRQLPWETLAAYYLPTVSLLLVTFAFLRRRRTPAGATVGSLSVSFSNTVQFGIPVVTALYGTAGLSIHIGIVSLQSLVLLTIGTVLAETSGGRASGERGSALRTAGRVMLHPVVLPVLLGLAYNATGWSIPGPADDILATLSAAVVPVSLVAIGLSLHLYGVAGYVRGALLASAGKLVLQPAAVFAVSYWGFGLRGLPLTVAVLCAALPVGSNVLLFASRYASTDNPASIEVMAEATAAIVVSTCVFLITGTGWLVLLSHLSG